MNQLMQARRAVATAVRTKDGDALRQARERVDAARRGLGERGPVWWTEGTPDLNQHMACSTPYAAWYAAVDE